jgi:hypothetical protein
MQNPELSRPLPELAPRLNPISVRVVLGDPGIDVAVADISVSGRVPGHVCDLPECPVDGWRRRAWMRPWSVGLVRGFLLAAEHHHDPAVGIELDHHVRALVDGPDVIVFVDADGVGEGPRVEVMTDLAHELPVGVELQQLRRGGAVGRPACPTTGENEHVAFRIDRDPRHFTEIDVGGSLRKSGTESNGMVGAVCGDGSCATAALAVRIIANRI